MKTLSALFFVIIMSSAIAQSVHKFKKPISIDQSAIQHYYAQSAAKTSSAAIGYQGWFNYEFGAQNHYNAISDFYTVSFWPDSTAYFHTGSSNSLETCFFNHIAEMVDFKSPVFSNSASTSWVGANPTTSFMIDSISIWYKYSRMHPNPTIVDTLIFTVFDNSTSTNISSNFFSDSIAANHMVDTFSFKDLGFNYSLNSIVSATNNSQLPAGYLRFKVLLTSADSTSGTTIKEKKAALPTIFSTSAANLVVADVMFKPGYAYTNGQAVDSTANVFWPIVAKENGPGSVPMHHDDCNYNSNDCDYSMSYFIMPEFQYGMAGPYNNRYYPSIYNPIFYDPAFGGTYFQHNLISFHLIDTLLSPPCIANAYFSVTPDSLNPGSYNAYNYSNGSSSLSYLWDFGDSTTSTQQYPFHQYSVPGHYVICLTVIASNGTSTCSSTYCDSSSVQKIAAGYLMSSFNVVSPTAGINEKINVSASVSAFPNPLQDELIINLGSGARANLSYVLFDALGQTVWSGKLDSEITRVNTSSLAKGFYTLNVFGDNGLQVKRFKLTK